MVFVKSGEMPATLCPKRGIRIDVTPLLEEAWARLTPGAVAGEHPIQQSPRGLKVVMVILMGKADLTEQLGNALIGFVYINPLLSVVTPGSFFTYFTHLTSGQLPLRRTIRYTWHKHQTDLTSIWEASCRVLYDMRKR